MALEQGRGVLFSRRVRGSWSELEGARMRGLVVLEFTPEEVPVELMSHSGKCLAVSVDVSVEVDDGPWSASGTQDEEGVFTVFVLKLFKRSFPAECIPEGWVMEFPAVFGKSHDMDFDKPVVKDVSGLRVLEKVSRKVRKGGAWDWGVNRAVMPLLPVIDECTRFVVCVVCTLGGCAGGSLDVKARVSMMEVE